MTAIKSGKLEVVAGDSGGLITVYWLESGNAIQQCKAHKTTVTDLDFDATKIVSCGMDCCVKVIDIASCEILHSIRGHDGPVLSCCFDTVKIITLSIDGTIRHWMWESRLEANNSNERYHAVVNGDTMASICKLYGVSIANIVKWNVNQDMKSIEVGQTLLVEKGKGDSDSNKEISILSPTHHFRRNPNTAPDVMKMDTVSLQLPDEISHDVLCEPTSLASRLLRSERD